MRSESDAPAISGGVGALAVMVAPGSVFDRTAAAQSQTAATGQGTAGRGAETDS